MKPPTYKIDIVIPTYQKVHMLERCLQSLSQVELPCNVENIWIVENGGKYGVDSVIERYCNHLPLHYKYLNEGNSSLARNHGIESSNADVIIFFDNDMLFRPDTLTAYADAFEKHGEAYFYGGSLEPDYALAPKDWLIDFLPLSAKGFDLGQDIIVSREPHFLGGNHAIFRKHIDKYGAFDAQGTTGNNKGAIGEETRLQTRLLEHGILGIYVPKARVLHYVPEENCSKKWILKRCRRTGQMLATEEKSKIQKHVLLGMPYFRILLTMKLAAKTVTSILTRQSEEKRFAALYDLNTQLGMLSGYFNMARSDGKAS